MYKYALSQTKFGDCLYFLKKLNKKLSSPVYGSDPSLYINHSQPKPIKISFILRLGNVLRSIIECKLIFT